jgi:hypothetical protein
LADAASSIFSSIVELGSFGTGFAAGWIGTTFALAKMMEE